MRNTRAVRFTAVGAISRVAVVRAIIAGFARVAVDFVVTAEARNARAVRFTAVGAVSLVAVQHDAVIAGFVAIDDAVTAVIGFA